MIEWSKQPLCRVLPMCRNLAVHNISSRPLSKVEQQIIGLNHNFIPSPSQNELKRILTSFDTSIDQYHRSILLACYFINDNAQPKKKPILYTRSSWTPEGFHLPNSLQTHVNDVGDLLNDIKKSILSTKNVHKNIPFKWREIARNIKNDPSLIIRPADKNLGLVVMDTAWYSQQGMDHLHSNSYLRVFDDFQSIWGIIKQKLKTWCNHYGKKLIDYLDDPKIVEKILLPGMVDEGKPAYFYMLPKIHKHPSVEMRPIVSNVNYITCAASTVLHHLLLPIVETKVKWALNSSTQLLRQLDAMRVPEHTILVSADVTSLYPNIPTEDGLMALEFWLSEHPLKSEILYLSEIVLRNTFLTFENMLYVQCKGTAMGTPFAPVYAILFLGYLEKKLLHKITLLHPGKTTSEICYFRRYIDDIFILWFESEPTLMDFIKLYNSTFNSIKIKAIVSHSSVDFLDLTIEKRPEIKKLFIKTYNKPMNKFLYLHPHSEHPKFCLKGWIRAELLRLIRNSSIEDEFLKSKDRLLKHLNERGYTKRETDPIFGDKSIHFDLRNQLLHSLKPKQMAFDRRLFLQIPFCKEIEKRMINSRFNQAFRDWKQKFSTQTCFIEQIFVSPPMICFKNIMIMKAYLTRKHSRSPPPTREQDLWDAVEAAMIEDGDIEGPPR